MRSILNNEEVIKLSKIRKVYKTGDENTVALDDINLTIKKNEFVAVMGPSGSGKSTLMHILGLLDVPTSGEYFLAGQNVSKLGKNKLAEIRNSEIGFVFQEFNLLQKQKKLSRGLGWPIVLNIKVTNYPEAKSKELRLRVL
jgi:putative ABC transport system ATP-binding protein